MEIALLTAGLVDDKGVMIAERFVDVVGSRGLNLLMKGNSCQSPSFQGKYFSTSLECSCQHLFTTSDGVV